MKIYIDFDGTIYDTHKLDNKFIEIFKKHNIESKYIKQLINELKNYNTIANVLIKEFNLNKNILNEIDNFVVFRQYLNFLQKQSNIENLYSSDVKYIPEFTIKKDGY